MKVIKVELERDRILSMPEIEHTFFLALGHVANEINAITKMMYWASNTAGQNEVNQHGSFALTLYFTRLLAGQLNEAWEFFQKNFFGSTLARDYEPQLDSECGGKLQYLKRYFSSSNRCHQIRNHFAFHYSAADIGGTLPKVDDKLLIYLERGSAPNNLFYCSEVIMAHALLDLLYGDSTESNFDRLVDELFDIALHFVQVSDCLMEAIILKNGIEMRKTNPEVVKFESIMPFRSISIPWFTDTSEAVAEPSRSA